jgi:hypothetical protein
MGLATHSLKRKCPQEQEDSSSPTLDTASHRYPLVGGVRQRYFDGINLKPRKRLENAQTPTTTAPAYFAGGRVHAVLASLAIACS